MVPFSSVLQNMSKYSIIEEIAIKNVGKEISHGKSRERELNNSRGNGRERGGR